MTVLRMVAFSCVAMLVTAGTASAQVSLRVLGGVTTAAGESPFVAGSLGGRLAWIEIDVEGGRMFDILPEGLLDRLNDLQRQQGLPVQAIAKLPATYALGNLRFISPAGPVQPFVSAGAGFARLEPRFDVVVAGISLGDVFGLTSGGTQTEPLATAGAGLRIDVGRGYLDLGYRYLVIFSDFGLESGLRVGRTHVNSVYGALGISF